MWEVPDGLECCNCGHMGQCVDEDYEPGEGQSCCLCRYGSQSPDELCEDCRQRRMEEMIDYATDLAKEEGRIVRRGYDKG